MLLFIIESEEALKTGENKIYKIFTTNNNKLNMSTYRPLCALCSSSELSSQSSSSPPAGVDVCSSFRGSALCFLLRLFFFLPAELEQGWVFPETGFSGLSGGLVSTTDPPHLGSLLLNRTSSVGMGEVTKWAGTISCVAENIH